MEPQLPRQSDTCCDRQSHLFGALTFWVALHYQTVMTTFIVRRLHRGVPSVAL